MDFKSARKSRELTLEQASELAGYSISTISDFERTGEGSDRLKFKLAQVYGIVPPDAQVIGNTDSSKPPSKLQYTKAEMESALHDGGGEEWQMMVVGILSGLKPPDRQRIIKAIAVMVQGLPRVKISCSRKTNAAAVLDSYYAEAGQKRPA